MTVFKPVASGVESLAIHWDWKPCNLVGAGLFPRQHLAISLVLQKAVVAVYLAERLVTRCLKNK